MKKSFDVVVIGTGVAATTAAARCRAAGRTVAIVDERPFGGTCALRGCDPKKVLVGAAEILDWSRRMEGKGIRAGGARIDWPELMRFKRTFTDPVPGDREKWFAETGMEAFRGHARFVAPNAVEAGGDTLEGRQFVIATGARPAALKIAGAEHLVTSDRFLELERLPDRLVFVGGGFISFEFAHVAARAGAQVTIVHEDDRPLARFDRDLVNMLLARTRAAGIHVELGAPVKAVEPTADGVAVRAGDRTFPAAIAVHGAGRPPDLDRLNLEAAGVEYSARGVKLNEFLQSVSNPAVYAAGDAAGSGPPLTPTASYDGDLVADNLLEGNHRRHNYNGFASVVYTIPPLASAGLLEETARERGLKFRRNFQDTSGWYSSRRVAEECSGFKVLIEEPSGRILGAHLLAPQSDETINVFALAIRAGLTAAQVKDVLYSYPTHGSDVSYMLG